MTTNDPPQSITAFTRGDARQAQNLTATLRTLHEREQDPATRQLLEDVLSGRRTVREFIRSPQGQAIANRGAAIIEDAWSQTSQEEREALRQRLDDMGDTPPPPFDPGSNSDTPGGPRANT